VENRAGALQALWRQFDRANQPTQEQTEALEDLYRQIDISIQSLLLTSLPTQIIQDNGSFIKICHDRPNTDGASLTIFRTVDGLFSHKVEVEKVELMNQLSKLIGTNELMGTYIGTKQTARAILDERFASKYDDAFQRTYILAGIREDKEYKTLYDNLLQQQNQTLTDTITAMEIFARERQVKTASSSSSPSSSSSSSSSSPSALHTNDSQQKKQKKGKKENHNKKNNEKQHKGKKENDKPPNSRAAPCRNFAVNGTCSYGDKCNRQHVDGHILRQKPCPFATNCRNLSNGMCLYQPSSHSSSSPSSSSSANAVIDDAWGLAANSISHF